MMGRMNRWLACVLLLSAASAPVAHAEDRVAAARTNMGKQIRERFEKAGVPYPAGAVYLRVFKHEKELELWAGKSGAELKRVHTYPICSASGGLGPKREMGDGQVPEGFYELDRFNPVSNYHLSLRVNYPNPSDAVRGSRGKLGGDIYVHGNCVSIGCMAIEDRPIEEVYLALLDAHAAGVKSLPIHIFPERLDPAGWKSLQARAKEQGRDDLVAFWSELLPAYQTFEATHRVPLTRIDPRTGAYQVQGSECVGETCD